jgi:hypothetical protein
LWQGPKGLASLSYKIARTVFGQLISVQCSVKIASGNELARADLGPVFFVREGMDAAQGIAGTCPLRHSAAQDAALPCAVSQYLDISSRAAGGSASVARRAATGSIRLAPFPPFARVSAP